jgi:hypothetical protein
MFAISIVVLSVEGATAQAEVQRLGNNCGLDLAVGGEVFDWSNWSSRPLQPSELTSIADWQGESIWINDGNYGYWNTPPELPMNDLTYNVLLTDGTSKRIDVIRSNGTWYVWGFNSLNVTTDLAGQHEGAHDMCAYMAMMPT